MNYIFESGRKIHMNKKFFLGSLAMIVALPVIVEPVQAKEVVAEISQDFKDVPKTHSVYKEIMAMRDQGIINGYPENMFRPAQSISRVHTAALFVRSLDLPPVRAGKEFKDVPKSNAYYNDVQTVYRAGIFDGKSNGTFGVSDNLTRAQMAKVLVNAFGLDIQKGYIFSDVDEDNWAKDYISTLYMHGITTGSNGRYMPDQPVSRAHYSTFLFRALNPDEAPKPEKPLQPNPLPKPELKPETPNSGWVNVFPKDGTVKPPAGWSESMLIQHEQKIKDTVFNHSPKKGSGQSFGRSSMLVSNYDNPESLQALAQSFKNINSDMTVDEWVADVNKAIETGEAVIARDNSYGVCIMYYEGYAILIFIR